jgi:hypothetical protein
MIVASSEDAEAARSSQELNEHTYEIRIKAAQSERRSDIPGAAAVTIVNPLPASVAGFFFQSATGRSYGKVHGNTKFAAVGRL